MDIYETRIKNLREIIGDNQLKDFADAFELDPSYLSQLLNGHRRMGERAAMSLENKLGLMAGTLGQSPLRVGAGITLLQTMRAKGLQPAKISEYDQSSKLTFRWEKLDEEQAAELKRRQGLTFEQAVDEDNGLAIQELRKVYPSAAPQDDLFPEALAVAEGTVPVVGKAMLGTDGYFEEMDYPAGSGDGRLLISSTDPNAYGLRVVGTSMAPRIKNGEFVLVEPNHTYVSGDEVLVKTIDGKAMIKEYMYCRDGLFRFDSVNPGNEPIYLPVDQVEKVHYVGGILKSSRFSPDLN